MASMTRSTVGPSEQTLLLVQCSCTTVYTVLYWRARSGQRSVHSNRSRDGRKPVWAVIQVRLLIWAMYW